jgi:hypothetical protein
LTRKNVRLSRKRSHRRVDQSFPRGPSQKWWLGPLRSASVMTSDDSLSLILRRLDEIERKLDRIMEELRAPTAIGYSVGRGNRPRED